MIDMTVKQAVKVSKALNDIEDFEMFMDAVQVAYYNTEGDLSDFFNQKMLPMMEEELARRKAILEDM
jgi:hypothetical protein